MPQRPPGCFTALWFSFIGFIASIFKTSHAPVLPIPVTAKANPTSASVRVTHQRINLPYSAWVKEPSPLKPTVTSPISSSARTSPACRSRSTSTTPKRTSADLFHPPASPFPNISLSGIFATPPLLASPRPPSLGRLSLASPPVVQILASPPPFRGSPNPSFHTIHSASPRTPSSGSAVIVHLDRSTFSPTTMSDGSLEVISLGDPRPFLGSPVDVADIGRLPSPWSPIGKSTSADVWMSVDGLLMNATGPVMSTLQDDSPAPRIAMVSLSRISTSSIYSSPSALDALGISVFVDLDKVGDEGDIATKADSRSVLKLNTVGGQDHPAFITQGSRTPRKRRDTLPSVTPQATTCSARATKCLSTPLTKLDNTSMNHIRSATSISSMAYELRMGLFADGRSITAFENIISLLDQASPESIRATPVRNDAMHPVVAG